MGVFTILAVCFGAGLLRSLLLRCRSLQLSPESRGQLVVLSFGAGLVAPLSAPSMLISPGDRGQQYRWKRVSPASSV